jgi:hypothetical protein
MIRFISPPSRSAGDGDDLFNLSARTDQSDQHHFDIRIKGWAEIRNRGLTDLVIQKTLERDIAEA